MHDYLQKSTSSLKLTHFLSPSHICTPVSSHLKNGFRIRIIMSWHPHYYVLASALLCLGIRIIISWHPHFYVLASALLCLGIRIIMSWHPHYHVLASALLCLVMTIWEYNSPHEPPCPSVGWLIGCLSCYNFLKGRKVTFPCSYRRTCLCLQPKRVKLQKIKLFCVCLLLISRLCS